MKRWFFTFGLGQPLKDYYVIIEAESGGGARAVMIEQFGGLWSSQYDGDSQNARGGYFEDLKPIGPLQAAPHHEDEESL